MPDLLGRDGVTASLAVPVHAAGSGDGSLLLIEVSVRELP